MNVDKNIACLQRARDKVHFHAVILCMLGYRLYTAVQIKVVSSNSKMYNSSAKSIMGMGYFIGYKSPRGIGKL